MIEYCIGDATSPERDGSEPIIIAHVCNNQGGWGRGFVMAISSRWSEPERAYRRWAGSGERFELGMIQVIGVEDDLWVANMVAQDGYGRGGRRALDYEALAVSLAKLAGRARELGAGVVMPRIGAGLGGGDWDVIAESVERELVGRGVRVRVYDLA